MITRRNLTDLLNNRLSGGDAPDDIKGKYHPQVIEAVIDMVFSDMVHSDEKLRMELSLPYVVTPTETGGVWKAALSVFPNMGSQSISFAYGCDEDDWYVIRKGALGNFMMKILKPEPSKNFVWYEDGYLKFGKKPHETVTAYIIANPSSMDEDAPIILVGKEGVFLQACYSAIRSMDAMPMEVLNDQKPDMNGASN